MNWEVIGVILAILAVGATLLGVMLFQGSERKKETKGAVAKVDGLRDSMDTKVDGLRDSMDGKIDGMGAKVDGLRGSMDAKIDSTPSRATCAAAWAICTATCTMFVIGLSSSRPALTFRHRQARPPRQAPRPPVIAP